MSKWFLGLLLGLQVLIGIIVGIAIYNMPEEDNSVLEELKSIESKIELLSERKDSIRAVVDSTHVKIVTNEKHYQEVVNTIINQSASADSEYVIGYIRQYLDKDTLLNSSRAQ